MTNVTRLPTAASEPVIQHPLAATARANGLGAGHLCVVEAGAATLLPAMLGRAEISFHPQPVPDGLHSVWTMFQLDARTLPQIGSRDRFRGILKLVIEPTALDVVEARVEGLDWRRSAAGRWSSVPCPLQVHRRGGYDGRAAEIAWHMAAWAMTPQAAPALAATFQAGAEAGERALASHARLAGMDPVQGGRVSVLMRDAAVLRALADSFAGRAATVDPSRQAALLKAAHAAAQRVSHERAAMQESARVAAERGAAARQARQRVEAAAPALLSALEGLLEVVGAPASGCNRLARATQEARRAIAAAHGGGPVLADVAAVPRRV